VFCLDPNTCTHGPASCDSRQRGRIAPMCHFPAHQRVKKRTSRESIPQLAPEGPCFDTAHRCALTQCLPSRGDVQAETSPKLLQLKPVLPRGWARALSFQCAEVQRSVAPLVETLCRFSSNRPCAFRIRQSWRSIKTINCSVSDFNRTKFNQTANPPPPPAPRATPAHRPPEQWRSCQT
jgi:hypothetical protein